MHHKVIISIPFESTDAQVGVTGSKLTITNNQHKQQQQLNHSAKAKK